MLLLGKSKQIK